MPELRLFTTKSNKECILALGTFDGVHRGHVNLLSETVRLADNFGLRSGVFFFSYPPAFYLNKEKKGLLTSPEARCRIFKTLGLDFAIIADFPDYKDISSYSFIEDVLKSRFLCKGVVCGFNYSFGKNRTGSPALLAEAFPGMTKVMEEYHYLGKTVSSSAIRYLISSGKVAEAAEMSGRFFEHSSIVISGRKEGRTLGFPTINQLPSNYSIIPMSGVYITQSIIPDGRILSSVTDVGTSPTFGNSQQIKYETHIPDFSEDLYGKEVTIRFIDRIRDEIRFPNRKALIDQLKKDVSAAERFKQKHD